MSPVAVLRSAVPALVATPTQALLPPPLTANSTVNDAICERSALSVR